MIKNGVISLGEVIIDYIATDKSNTDYHRFLGGATVNVAVHIARYNFPSYYLTKLGMDEESLFVEAEFYKEKVKLNGCVRSETKQLCEVYVHQDEAGDRYFHSYKNPTPEEWLLESQIDAQIFNQSKVFYFGSGTLFHPISRRTTEAAMEYAKNNELFIAFDTNIRMKRWQSEVECKQTITGFLQQADLVKMAEDELLFLTGASSLKESIEATFKWEIPYLFITRGENGACVVNEGKVIDVAKVQVRPVDTTGAGDAFMAALIGCFHEYGTPATDDHLKSYLTFANEAGARTVTKLGSF
ncbi:carbohydrate kinase family protein [Cytobacillus purgationiresistens]|uniref:Fructokinase n=1 Tax=Cytobacillus purgationiresistens TaxID=863449 RepID=A0ABU0AB44_9BACI|nr:carbohydrate kinase [Cytobacillus purgationiresistens]MDQ0268245.1 fructokinase [Cytobacillus purgationiresistens]